MEQARLVNTAFAGKCYALCYMVLLGLSTLGIYFTQYPLLAALLAPIGVAIYVHGYPSQVSNLRDKLFMLFIGFIFILVGGVAQFWASAEMHYGMLLTGHALSLVMAVFTFAFTETFRNK